MRMFLPAMTHPPLLQVVSFKPREKHPGKRRLSLIPSAFPSVGNNTHRVIPGFVQGIHVLRRVPHRRPHPEEDCVSDPFRRRIQSALEPPSRRSLMAGASPAQMGWRRANVLTLFLTAAASSAISFGRSAPV